MRFSSHSYSADHSPAPADTRWQAIRAQKIVSLREPEIEIGDMLIGVAGDDGISQMMPVAQIEP